MHRAAPTLLALAAAFSLAACGTSDESAPPTWQPSPALGVPGGPGAAASPIIPVPSAPRPSSSAGPGRGSSGPDPGGSSGAPSPSSTKRVDPNVVATHLRAPVGLTMLPDGSALVGERTTGRIVQVQPRAGEPVPTVRTLSGLDTSGDGGLLDLALSPTYDEDGLVYAYITTAHDNRVVDFTLTGPVTPVLTGIPKGRTGNTGRIVFGADANLYIGTGDAGRPRLAARAGSLAGKVLRVDGIGDPAAHNPTPSSPIWTRGHHVVDGLCPIPHTAWTLDVESGAAGETGELNFLSAGAAYGWPASAGRSRGPIATLPIGYGGPGDCAVLNGRVWVTSLDGHALLSAPLRAAHALLSAGRFTPVLKNRYGRLKTVVAAPDGALWLTTSNRDGHGTPVADDERVIRYLPALDAGNSPV